MIASCMSWVIVLAFACFAIEVPKVQSQGVRLVPQGSSEPRLEVDSPAGSLLSEIKYGMVTDAANLCGVEPGLILAMAFRESSLVWPETKHEAVGYMQIKPASARLISPTLNVHEAWGNFLAGACYLRHMYDLTGDWREAVHRYAVGPRGEITERTRIYANEILGGER